MVFQNATNVTIRYQDKSCNFVPTVHNVMHFNNVGKSVTCENNKRGNFFF